MADTQQRLSPHQRASIIPGFVPPVLSARTFSDPIHIQQPSRQPSKSAIKVNSSSSSPPVYGYESETLFARAQGFIGVNNKFEEGEESCLQNAKFYIEIVEDLALKISSYSSSTRFFCTWFILSNSFPASRLQQNY